jgi:GAF domain-containing protein
MKYTIDEIMATKPCGTYTRSRVEELMDGRETVSPSEIAAVPILAEDRLWILIALATPRIQRLFAALEARDALLAWQEREGMLADVRLWSAIAVAIWHADGLVVDKILAAAVAAARAAARAARDAAWDAAWNAAWNAARAAAWNAARDAARAAWHAARAAAWNAAGDAAGAAWNAARERQITRLVTMIEEEA